MNDRLYRTVDDRVLAGVCGGLAVRLGLDPSLVRVGYAIVALLTGIFPLLVLYVIMAAVVPEEPTGFAGAGRSPPHPAPTRCPGGPRRAPRPDGARARRRRTALRAGTRARRPRWPGRPPAGRRPPTGLPPSRAPRRTR